MSAEDPVAQFLQREKTELDGVLDENDTILQQGDQEQNDVKPDLGSFDSNTEQPLADMEDGPAPDLFGGDGAVEPVITPEPEVRAEPKAPSVPRIEPEKIRRWREEQAKRLEVKDAEEEKEIEKWRAQAKKELEDWYKQRADQLEKSKKAARAAEEDLIAERETVAPGQEWERISKMCEFNPKAAKNAKDVTRMRSLILQLKQGKGDEE